MPESVIQPDSNHDEAIREQLERDEEKQGTALAEAREPLNVEKPESAEASKIIWTPRFFVIFAITLVVGISFDSLFASGWSTGVVSNLGFWFILGYIGLAGLGWLVLGICTRSLWIRVGCIFGGLCTAFLILNVFTNILGVDPNTPAQAYINVASCTALLGAYIGLSIEGTLLRAWDFWLFFLIPILGCIGVTLIYLQTPQASIITSENAIAAATLIAACLVWWARPSCWKSCPGPTFIFGIVPVIQLSMALVNNSMHNFFLLQVLTLRTGLNANLNNFFFAQFILLCLLLGCIRIAKSEIRN